MEDPSIQSEAGCSRCRQPIAVPADRRIVVASHPGMRCGSRMRSAFLTQRQPGRLRGVVAFFWGQPVASADAVKHAAVVVCDFGNIKRGAWCIGHGLLGEHVRVLRVWQLLLVRRPASKKIGDQGPISPMRCPFGNDLAELSGPVARRRRATTRTVVRDTRARIERSDHLCWRSFLQGRLLTRNARRIPNGSLIEIDGRAGTVSMIEE
jgi:hypothetical protein